MPKNNFIIDIDHLTKKFKTKTILNNLSLQINQGEIFGLIGSNGSGKTTLINILLGLISPDSGRLHLFHQPLSSNLALIRSRLNMMSTYNHLQDEVSIMDNLLVYAHLYHIPHPHQTINQLLKEFDFQEYVGQNRKISTLSSGENTRLMFCKALINNPEVLLLDEPTSSLDPLAAEKVRQIIINLTKKRKITIFITSHNLAEIETVCTRVGLLKDGHIVKIVDGKNVRSLLKYY